MKKLTKRTVPFVLVLVFALSVLLAAPATAAVCESIYKNDNDFVSSWTKTAYFDNERGILQYGFEKALLGAGKDTISAFHTTRTHRGGVETQGHWAYTDDYAAGKWTNTAKKTHESGRVQYLGYGA